MSRNEETVISVENVSKNFILPHEKVSSLKGLFTSAFRRQRTYEVRHALQDINFEIKKGEFFGIVGRNGSGKSTMLKILAQIYQPNQGKVNVQGKLVPFIELGVGFNPELTGRENVYLNGALLGFTKREIDAQYDEIVAFAELEDFMDQKLKNYSSGMQVRLAFSVATTAKADILLIDEVLAVGDADFQRKCFDYFQKLKGSDTTVVFVTHDMNAVREYCDRAILIEKSKIVASGSADKVAMQYTRMFIDTASGNAGNKTDSRWGDGSIRFTKMELETKKIDKQEKVVFTLSAKAERDLVNPIFGFLIKNSAGAHIMGTNTQILKQKIPDVRKGETVNVTWQVPNIFNEGVHYIDPAIVYNGGSEVADWFDQGLSFEVFKEHRTPYLVNPPITCHVKNK